MVLLSLSYYFVSGEYYNEFCQVIYCKNGIFTLVTSILFLWLGFLVNALTSEQYSFVSRVKEGSKFILVFTLFGISWEFFFLGEKIFKIMYLVTYWVSLLSLEIILRYGMVKGEEKPIEKMDFSIFLLIYYLWLFYSIFLSIPFIIYSIFIDFPKVLY